MTSGAMTTLRIVVLAALMGALGARSACAQTLADAIATAYRSNPTLQSARAQLMGVDEGYVQARAGLGPTVGLQGVASAEQSRFGYLVPGVTNTGQVQLNVLQTLYSSGHIAAQVAAARGQIEAGRQGLRVVEGNVVLATITAYADVLRDQAILNIHTGNIGVLDDEVKESRIRQQDGEITTTDVAQAEAQLAAERAVLSTAQAQLQISRAEYFAAVGEDPGPLAPASGLPGLPRSADEAFRIAGDDAPDLLQAQYAELASEAQVRAARAANGATVSVGLSASYGNQQSPFTTDRNQGVLTAQVTVNQPLFSSGLTSSQIRQALDQNTNDRLLIEAGRRTQVQSVANAWNQLSASQSNITAQKEAIRADQAAFTGMRVEQRAGDRATLDVLITQQNLIAAKVALLTAQHDQLIAEATLLRAIGRLEAATLVPALPQYDQAANLRDAERHGATPWMGAVLAIDKLAEPAAHQHPIPAPAPMRYKPALTPGGGEPPEVLVTQFPVAPIPGTVAP